MAPPSADIRSLIRKLTAATRSGSVEWRSSSSSRFILERGVGSVRLESVDSDGSHPYRFQVRNANNAVVVTAETVLGERYADWETEIAELYEVARRNALGVDTVLRGLEQDLGLDQIEDPAENDIPF